MITDPINSVYGGLSLNTTVNYAKLVLMSSKRIWHLYVLLTHSGRGFGTSVAKILAIIQRKAGYQPIWQ